MIHIADFAVIAEARACHAAPAIYASSCEREAQAKIVTSMTKNETSLQLSLLA